MEGRGRPQGCPKEVGAAGQGRPALPDLICNRTHIRCHDAFDSDLLDALQPLQRGVNVGALYVDSSSDSLCFPRDLVRFDGYGCADATAEE